MDKDVRRLPIRGHLAGKPALVVEVTPYNRTGWMASVKDRPESAFSVTPHGAIIELVRYNPHLFKPDTRVHITVRPDTRVEEE